MDFGGAQEWILEQLRNGMDFGGAQEWDFGVEFRNGFWGGAQEWDFGGALSQAQKQPCWRWW